MSTLSAGIKRHFVGMPLVVLLIVLSAAAWTFMQPPVFEVSAVLLVQDQQEDPAQNSTQQQQRDRNLHAAVELLQGNVLADQVVTAIGPKKIFPDLGQKGMEEEALRRQAVRKFQQQLTVASDSRPHNTILRISFLHQKPETAVQAVDILIRLFREQYRKIQYPQTAFLEEQIVLSRQQVQQAEQAVSMFQRNNRIYSFPEERQELAEQQDTMKSQLAAENKELEKLTAALDALQQEFAAVPVSAAQEQGTETSKELEEDKAGFLDLKLYEHELLSKYKEDDQLIADVRQQIGMLRQRLSVGNEAADSKKHLEETADQIVSARIAHNRQQEKTELLLRRLSQIENKRQHLSEQEAVLGNLQAKAEQSKAVYTEYADRLAEQQKALKAAGMENLPAVIEKPMLPAAPVRPKQLRNILAAAFFGLLCSLCYAFMRRK